MFGAQFGEQVWRTAQARGLRDEDVVATLTMFTTFSIVQAYRDFLPAMPDEVIVSGGGARNGTLLRMLRQQLEPNSRVLLSDEVGIPSEAKEALAFALLAYETVHGRPSNLTAATGAKRAVVLGDITPGRFSQGSRML
jgi:anhydro-N-acetylmuramic acid kinase